MITTRDIARAAGLAQSTVSRALRNEADISSKTCQRVQALARSMGYKPNPLVSAFMSLQRSAKAPRQRHVLAYVTTDSSRDAWRSIQTYTDFYEGAAERAASYGFELQEFWLREPRMTGSRMTEILYTRGIKGVLVAPLRSDAGGSAAGRGHLSLDWRRFSAATIGYTMMRPIIDRAVTNHLHGIRVTLRQLKRLGYRRPGLALHGIHDARVDHIWSTAFGNYLFSQRPASRVPPFLPSTPQFTAEHFLRWFKQYQPDVVIAGSWRIFPWIQQAGIRVPEDIGYAMLDLVPKASFPAAAGINGNNRAVAAAAIDLIVGQLNRNQTGLPECPKLTLIDGKWTDGATVRKLSAQSTALAERDISSSATTPPR
jgi:LacI family transcriptional regulator